MKNYQQKAVEPTSNKKAFEPAPVTKYMTPASKLITFQPDMDIMEVIDTLLEHEITGGPVLNSKGDLVGLIDDKDCLKVLFDMVYHNQRVKHTTVSHYMSHDMKTISDEANVLDVADAFLNTKFKRLLVVDSKGRLKGQISRQDILSAIHDFNESA